MIQGADLDIYVYDSDGKLVGSDEGDGFLSFADVDGMRPDQYSIFVNVNDSRDRGQGIVSYVLVVFASIDILSAMPSRGFENIIACDLNPILRVEFSSSGQNIGIHGFSDSIWSISKELRQKMPTNRSAVYWFSQDLNDAISITYTYRDRALASRVSLMRTVDLGERLILDESDKHTSYADFSPDKAYIAGRRSGSVPVWRSGDGSLLAEYEFPNGSNTRVRFSPDGQTLAAHGSAEIRLWRVSDGAVLMTFGGTQKIWDFAFSPDGQLMATSHGPEDSSLQLWRLSDGSPIRTIHVNGQLVRGVAFSPDGSQLATASDDGLVRLWRVTDGILLRSFAGHLASATSVAFSPDGRSLVSGSFDGTARLWRIP